MSLNRSRPSQNGSKNGSKMVILGVRTPKFGSQSQKPGFRDSIWIQYFTVFTGRESRPLNSTPQIAKSSPPKEAIFMVSRPKAPPVPDPQNGHVLDPQNRGFGTHYSTNPPQMDPGLVTRWPGRLRTGLGGGGDISPTDPWIHYFQNGPNGHFGHLSTFGVLPLDTRRIQ